MFHPCVSYRLYRETGFALFFLALFCPFTVSAQSRRDVLQPPPVGESSTSSSLQRKFPEEIARGDETVSTTETQTQDAEAMVDPFMFNSNTPRSAEFVPYERGTIPPGIEVLGIIVPSKNSPAVAALAVPGHLTPYYVREGDIIGMNIPESGNSRSASSPLKRKQGATAVPRSRSRTAVSAPPRTPVSSSKASYEFIYIQIGTITGQQVELHPMSNPENVRILQ